MRKFGKRLIPVVLTGLVVLGGCGTQATTKSSSTEIKTVLPVFAAGTLAEPFKELDKAFEAKYPNVKVQAQFGGSVKMVKQVTELKQAADVVAVADYILLLFITFPLINMLGTQSWPQFFAVAGMPDVQSSICLSLAGALITAGIAAVLGIPLAYLLANRTFALKALVEGIVDLPLAVPHTVAGIALLFVFGRTGPAGKLFAVFGLQFWGTLGGVVIGMLFVSLPYMVNSAREGFQNVDNRLEKAARTLGASPVQVFWQVSFPLALRSILSGIVLTYARAVAEFGAFNCSRKHFVFPALLEKPGPG